MVLIVSPLLKRWREQAFGPVLQLPLCRVTGYNEPNCNGVDSISRLIVSVEDCITSGCYDIASKG